MKKFLFLLIAIASTCAFAEEAATAQGANTAQGAKSSGNEDVGMYGEVQFGAANSSKIDAGVNAAGAGRVDLGYKYSPYMGFEMGMTGTTQQIGGVTQAPMQLYDVSFKGFLPISDYFDLHGQVGGAYVSMAAPTYNGILTGAGSDATAKLLLGAGFDVFLDKSFAITVNDYNYLGTDSGAAAGAGGNTNIVMGGLKYNF